MASANEPPPRLTSPPPGAAPAAQLSDEVYRVFFQASPHAIVLVGPDGTILDCNGAAEQLIGLPRETFVGRHPAELATLGPEGVADCLDGFQRLLAGEAVGPIQVASAGPDGEPRCIEATCAQLPVGGRDPLTLITCRDITERRRAEQALRDSEERYRLTLRHVHDVVCAFDGELRVLDVSPSVERILGYSPEELIGRRLTDFDILAPGSIPVALADAQRVMAGERIEPNVLEFIARDGSRKHGEVSGAPLVRDGRIVGGVAVARDITERKQAIDALSDNQEFLQSLLDAVQAGICVLDRDLTILQVNAWMEQTYAHAMPLVGQKCHRVYQQRDEPCPWCPSMRAIATELPHEEVVPILSASGPSGWAELSAFPLSGADGQVAGVIEYVKDVTARRKAQDALKREHDFFSAVLDTVGALVVVLDTEGRIAHFNRACEQATGYTFAEVGGKPFWDIFLHPGELDGVRAVFQELRAGRFPNQHENRWLARDGSSRLIAWSNTALLDEAGDIEYVIGTGLDITDRKALEEQLRQAQKMEAVGQLAGGVAHDFNNLLTAIAGYTELALAQLREQDPLRADLQEIRQAARRAATLVRQLLAFSRRQVLQPTILDLNAIVAGVEKMLRRLIGEDIQLRTDLDPELGTIEADPGQLEQVILNLVVNARDAMPEGGELAIRTATADLDRAYAREHVDARPGPHVLLAITDTGAGMDQDTLAHIFEPFFTTKGQAAGTGLGLSTAYGIVRQSGGHLTVRSEPGRGTTFSIYLPRLPAGARPHAPAESAPVVPRGAETILLVEDEEIVRSAARAMLQRGGYTVLEARNAGDALLICERHASPIHLLVTDVVMPVVNGPELAERLAAIRPDMKVLYMSGYTSGDTGRRLLEQGSVLLHKPFTPDTLARKVREVLDRPHPPDTASPQGT